MIFGRTEEDPLLRESGGQPFLLSKMQTDDSRPQVIPITKRLPWPTGMDCSVVVGRSGNIVQMVAPGGIRLAPMVVAPVRS